MGNNIVMIELVPKKASNEKIQIPNTFLASSPAESGKHKAQSKVFHMHRTSQARSS